LTTSGSISAEASALAWQFNRIEFFEPDEAIETIGRQAISGTMTVEEALHLAAVHHDASGAAVEQRRLWDPFGDRATRGILRNSQATADPAKLEKLEFIATSCGMAPALAHLRAAPTVTLDTWLDVHRMLFGAVFPTWAGRIREHPVGRGSVRFNLPHLVRNEAAAVLAGAAAPRFVAANLGYVYGELAFHHPFYDGNGRSLNTVFTELLRREGLRLAWERLEPDAYLAALTPAVLLRHYAPLDAFLGNLTTDI
jgi:cell filamentation protein